MSKKLIQLGCGDYARDEFQGYHWCCSSSPRVIADASNCWHPLEGSDGNSFEALNSRYARDKDKIYFYEQVLAGSDRNSFRVLTPICVSYHRTCYESYASDKTGGYYNGRRIPGSDGISFLALNTLYAADCHSAYCRGVKIEGVVRNNFQVFSDSPFATDGKSVYVWDPDHGELATRIKDAEPLSFQVLYPSSYGLDNNQVYYDAKVIAGADPFTFKLLFPSQFYNSADLSYAFDKNNVYYSGQVLEEADLRTFKLIDLHTAVDKKGIYYLGKYYFEVDKASLRPVENKCVRGFYPDFEDSGYWYEITSDGLERHKKGNSGDARKKARNK